MKIKMIESRKGSQDGTTVQEFHAGNIYDVSDALALVFLDMKIAEKVLEIITPEDKAPAIETPEKPKPKKAKGKK